MWVAKTSTGRIIEEGKDYQVIPGEPTPWVRLVKDLLNTDDYLRQLGIRDEGIYWLPKAPFYSLQYESTAEGMGDLTIKNFTRLTAHFNDHQFHLVKEADGEINTEKTTDFIPLVPSPEKK